MTILLLNSGKPRLLDLFCGAGGAGMGYYQAGFEVTGVDIHPQKRYPFRFVQGDAIEYLYKHGHEYDVIHASPPCQTHTKLNNIKKIQASTEQRYLDLVPQTRELLQMIAKPYVIENVVGAPLLNPTLLCGSMFGLKVYRHRLFETSWYCFAPPHYPHKDKTPPSGRGVSPKGFISINSGGARNIPEGYTAAGYKSMAMGIDWMTQKELTEAIPPAFTRWIGEQLLTVIQNRKAA